MKRILPVIVCSQFFCTSLWFAGNAVLPDLSMAFRLDTSFIAALTSAVQFGFITGTLIFALLAIADRFSPAKVFFGCALIAAAFNIGIVLYPGHSFSLLLFRFLTGFFLAGIYPVGMKIAADHFREGLGKSLGLLVGALVLGTAFPHLLRSMTLSLPWKYIFIGTSLLAVAGGSAMLLLVPDGPYRRKSQQFKLRAIGAVFAERGFRSAALGYFGHMWELYAFWAFVPVMLQTYAGLHPAISLPVSLLSFLVIGIGSVACAAAGYLSNAVGTKKLARICLMLSGTCCLLSPWLLQSSFFIVTLGFMSIWALTVIADSPLFSTLVAQEAPPAIKGSALTIVTCIGFAITIISIQLLTRIVTATHSPFSYWLLAPGPIFGVLALIKKQGTTFQ